MTTQNECILLTSATPTLQSKHYRYDKQALKAFDSVINAPGFLSTYSVGTWHVEEAVGVMEKFGTTKRHRLAVNLLRAKLIQRLNGVLLKGPYHQDILKELYGKLLEALFLLKSPTKEGLESALKVLKEYNEKERIMRQAWLAAILQRREAAQIQLREP